MSKLFGTDGIRGIANKDLTPELAFRVGRATAYVLGKNRKGSILIGRDTRYSGEMLESAIESGIVSMGIDVIRVGIIPTPAVAYLTRKYKSLAGIMISASHNPGEYNGIKIFNEDGLKLTDEIEDEIEKLIVGEEKIDKRPIKSEIGKMADLAGASQDFIDYLVSIFDIDLKGMKVCLDCGHGALYKIGPEVINRLNGKVIAINTEPDGMNINANCGSTNPDMISQLVKKEKADIGLSFDGDGDRVIATDENGEILNGDHILAIAGPYLKKLGKLNNDSVVGTIMTNMGLDDYLNKLGIGVIKTQVGDRYILEEMIEKNYSLGGEQSGHIIFLDYNSTGDGLTTGLMLIRIMLEEGNKISKLMKDMVDYPQVLVNARVDNKLKYDFDKNDDIRVEIERVEKLFKGKGRVVIRPSGTEPLVRVMIEAKDYEGIDKIAEDLAGFIESKIGLDRE